MSVANAGSYGGSAIPGNNVAAMLASPMARGYLLAMLSAMMGLPYNFATATSPASVAGTPSLPAAGTGSGAALGQAAGLPGTVNTPLSPPGSAGAPVGNGAPSPAAPPAAQPAGAAGAQFVGEGLNGPIYSPNAGPWPGGPKIQVSDPTNPYYGQWVTQSAGPGEAEGGNG